MEITHHNIAVLDDLQQLLKDEGFRMEEVEVMTTYAPDEEPNPTCVKCTIVEE